MQLKPEQLREFSTILQDAFNLFRFDEMLLYRLGINRETIALGNSVGEIIFRVFSEFQSRHTTTNLVMAAREANPDHPGLLSFAQQFRLAPTTLIRRGDAFAPTTSARELQLEIRRTNTSFDPAKWRRQLGEVESQICRIEINDGQRQRYGTGFLVGSETVMTNHHVVRKVIEKKISPEKVILRFDFKKSDDGTTINSGTIHRLASGDDWLLDQSEPSLVDTMTDTKGELPEPTQLDYALLKTEGSPGNEGVGGDNAAPSAPKRRWIKMPTTPYQFEANTPLYIVQHPQGEPLKCAIDTDSIIDVNGNGTRVRYRTNTEHGSSGSPCFNKEWELVALHHSGDPNYRELYKADYNEGIPIAAIHALLKERETDIYLGE